MILNSLIFASLLTGCGEKNPASVTPAAAAGPKISMALPDGTKAFVSTLIGSTTSNFAPTDSDGAAFEYTSLQFRGDGTWSAEGYVEAMDEKMECTEVGTWSMDPAESASKAAINLTINTSDCVSREAGHVSRYLATIEGGAIDVSYR